MQKTHIWIQIQPGLADKDCEELPKCRSGRTMTSGLILSTNFTDTTKHRWCFLGASSADLNKQIKTHQKVRKTLTQLNKNSLATCENNKEYWVCRPTQSQNEWDDLSQRPRKKLQLHKHFYHFCRHRNKSNGTILKNIVRKAAAPSGVSASTASGTH